jgi:hypothetical protein
VRQFETVAGVIQNVFPKVLEEARPGVLDEDGVVPVPSNNADLQER